MASKLSTFLSELKRRKVYHVAAAYMAVGAVIVFGVPDLASTFNLPTSAARLVIILVAIGFPIALVLAWAYELKPELPGEEKPLATLPDTGGSGQGKSIAVLPFESMSPHPEGDYFADGITEELTNALARQPGLRVAARTSAFTFKSVKVDIREIGQSLNVSHVIEGSVRRTDQALRITAQLINTADGYHIWSEQYDRSHGDVFKIQEEIAGCVTRRLLVDVPEGLGPSIATTDLSAYDAYLKGRHSLAQFAPKGVQEAIDHFEGAIRQDARFAPALAGLAEALTVQSIGFSDRRPLEAMPMAGEAADRAIELDPSLPEAHLAGALARMYGRWDYTGAKEGFDRALQLNPNFVEAHMWEEFYWTYVEYDFERALAANRRARQLSPLDARILSRHGTVHYLFGKLERAEEIFREGLAENPDDSLLHCGLADTVIRMGRKREPITHMEEAIRLAGGGPHAFLGMLAGFLGIQGEEAKAMAILKEMEGQFGPGSASGFWLAFAHAGVGQMDEAFSSLDRAVEERDSNLLYLFFVPRAVGLHEDPRFDGILDRIGLAHLLQFK